MNSWDDGKFYDIAFGVNKSRRYHSKMEAFFQTASDFVLGSNAILGAGAFISLVGGKDGWLAHVLIGIVALLSAIDNVIGFAKKSKFHSDLRRKFTELASEIELMEPTEENYRKAASERIKIEKDEAPIRRLIDLEARNDEARSRGVPEDNMVPLSKWQRMFGYCFTFDMERLERWKASHCKA